MEIQPQNPEFRINPETFTHVYGIASCHVVERHISLVIAYRNTQ